MMMYQTDKEQENRRKLVRRVLDSRFSCLVTDPNKLEIKH